MNNKIEGFKSNIDKKLHIIDYKNSEIHTYCGIHSSKYDGKIITNILPVKGITCKECLKNYKIDVIMLLYTVNNRIEQLALQKD